MPNPSRTAHAVAPDERTARAHDHVSPTRYAAAVLALVVGAGLCYGGAVQFYAGLLQARATALLATIDWDKGRTPVAKVVPAIDDLRGADRWWPQPINAYNRGVAETRLATQPGASGPDRALLNTAMHDLRLSIAQDPANAAAWSWLAYGLVIEQGASPATKDALATSIELARFDPTLLAMRCEIGLTIYSSLDAQERAAVDDQIRMLARHAIWDLAGVARVTHSLNTVMQVLLRGGDNKTIIRFMDMLRS